MVETPRKQGGLVRNDNGGAVEPADNVTADRLPRVELVENMASGVAVKPTCQPPSAPTADLTAADTRPALEPPAPSLPPLPPLP